LIFAQKYVLIELKGGLYYEKNNIVYSHPGAMPVACVLLGD
jgi:hypothetical protein